MNTFRKKSAATCAGLSLAATILFALSFAPGGDALRAQTPAGAGKPTADPLVLGLRDALYADAALDELVDQLDALPAVAAPIDLLRRGKYAEALQILEARSDRDRFVPAVLRAFAYRAQGNRARTLALLGKLSKENDARIALQAYRLLRDEGVGAGSAAGKVLGAIVESREPGRALAVAAFADGTARVYFPDGVAQLKDDKAATEAARSLLREIQRTSDRFQPERSRALPAPGRLRFVLLTPGGVRTAEFAARDLDRRSHPLFKSYQAALELQKQGGK